LAIRLLHTSDWHLGRRLYGRSRNKEQAAVLDWLTTQLEQEQVDLLIISGDIFDSSTPSHRAQTLYYRFLYQAARTACRHIIVVGGNHDSPALLDAPKALLAQLDVHVVGRACEAVEEEVFTLRTATGAPEAIVCAVPYLRDREVRTSGAGESMEEKQRFLLEGIDAHYQQVLAIARDRRAKLSSDLSSGKRPEGRLPHGKLPSGKLPLIATGHLFAAGGQTQAEDGVRELYVGALVRIDATRFKEDLDYLALGHLHSHQRVAGADHLRYSGAPLPVSFAEAGRAKSVVICDIDGKGRRIRAVEVPTFQPLERIRGDLPAIQTTLAARNAEGRPLWVEVVYTGREIRTDLADSLHPLVAGGPVEILRIRNQRRTAQLLGQTAVAEALEDLQPDDVFARCLEAHEIDADERPLLTTMFQEVVHELRSNDTVPSNPPEA
jgi:exonuclease SbcD